MADMKNIYNAPNKEIAAAELDNLKNGKSTVSCPLKPSDSAPLC